MVIYILATGNVSPARTYGHPDHLPDVPTPSTHRLAACEPDYREIIDPKLIRRMSRIIKMGMAASMECLNESGIPKPDAIVTGTAYGCLQDTENFLSKLIEHREEMLSPTSFIQSTHNTVGAQIALMLQCHSYNNTFVHRGFSFENALLDGILLLRENQAEYVLAGGVDEITETSHNILSRFGLYRSGGNYPGVVAGEGASFFLLSGKNDKKAYAKLLGLKTLFRPAEFSDVIDHIREFISSNGNGIEKIDVVVCGRSGDPENDKIYDTLERTDLFRKSHWIDYKRWSGEYPTSAAFGLWMASQLFRPQFAQSYTEKRSMSGISNGELTSPPGNVLLINHYYGIHYSLMLLSAC